MHSALTSVQSVSTDVSAAASELAASAMHLNAAVEAARAGEHGRGFAVVAAEVQSLARRTGIAAKEIRGLISDSSAKVETGTSQVNASGRTLDGIVRSVKRVTEMVAEIAAASLEQTAGLDQVNTAVTQVDHVTQRNAAQTEELSATADSLSEKSAHLQSLVAAFRLATDAGAPTPPPSRRAAREPAQSAVMRIDHATPRPRAAGDVEEL